MNLIRRIVILGASPLGVAYALGCQSAGYDITLIEPDEGAAERATHAMRRSQDTIAVQTSADGLTHADMVIEALQDDPELQAGLCDRIPETAIVASTSADVLRRHTKDPARLMGLTTFTPMHLRRLTEIRPLPETRKDFQNAVIALLQKLGRIVIAVPAGYASVGLRLNDRLQEAADTMLIEGAVLWEIDEAMVAFGFDLGRYEAEDLTGLSTAYLRRKARPRDPERRYIPIADRAVQEGRLGKSIGWGWYRYPGGGGAVIDPLIEDLVREEAWFEKVEQREFTAEEIQNRLALALINEAAAVLEDTPVMDAGMIDRIAIDGLGFPADRGGVLRYADSLGLSEIEQALQALAKEDPVVWKPCKMIIDCIRLGRDLGSS